MIIYNHRRGENPERKEGTKMYEINTINKAFTVYGSEEQAMAFAEELFKNHNYVEVKEVVTTFPWYAKAVRIFIR
jgi:hypothetical protein